MGKRLPKEILFTNPNASELEHLFSYSQNRHIFDITIMCIKYKVDYMNGEILNIEYHEDYKDCFHPIIRTQKVSDKITNMAASIINYYLDENIWLKGWSNDWNKSYSKLWNKKMKLDPHNAHFNYNNYEDSLVCYLLKSAQNSSLLCKIL